VTAVTTAGLLAGLFGSAFVPVAQGARDSGSTPKASLTAIAPLGAQTREVTDKKLYGFQGADAADGDLHDGVGLDITVTSTTGAEITSADISAVSSNGIVGVAWSRDAAGESQASACEDADVEAGFGTSDVITDAEDEDGDASNYILCLGLVDSNAPGSSVITIKINGVVVATPTVTGVGAPDSLELSITDGYKYLAVENTAQADWLKVVVKDAAGTVINGDNRAGFLTVSYEEVPDLTTITFKNKQGDSIDFLEADTLDGAGVDDGDKTGGGEEAAAGGRQQYFNLAEDVCNEESALEDDGDEGSSYSLKVKVTGTGYTVTSNAVTITCTLGSAGARISSVAADATTGGLEYVETGVLDDGEILVIATVVDYAGRPLGDGAAAADFNGNLDSTVVGNADLDLACEDFSAGNVTMIGGEFELCALIPGDTTALDAGKYTYKVTLTDVDLGVSAIDGDDAIEKTYTLVYYAVDPDAYDATISLTRNKARTQATFTADMGVSLGTVTFVVEFPNGTVREYSRKANADGVAKFRLNLRNKTVEAYALADADTVITNIVTVRFR
jgi:hypothetical protein